MTLASGAFALDPARALTQARLSVWTSESGLPQNTVGAIVQTRDGAVRWHAGRMAAVSLGPTPRPVAMKTPRVVAVERIDRTRRSASSRS
jgi:hypothetical protein